MVHVIGTLASFDFGSDLYKSPPLKHMYLLLYYQKQTYPKKKGTEMVSIRLTSFVLVLVLLHLRHSRALPHQGIIAFLSCFTSLLFISFTVLKKYILLNSCYSEIIVDHRNGSDFAISRENPKNFTKVI